MFQTFLYTHRHLGRESVPTAEYRCADDSRESGVNENLTGNYSEASAPLGIIVRVMNTIDFSSPHRYSSIAW